MFDSIESALEDLKQGKMIVVVDDEDRENEGDIIIPAQHVTPEVINFMAKEARGLICIALTAERCQELALTMMVGDNTSHHTTAFTVSVDYKLKGCTTGISAYDRATTIQALIDPTSKPEDFGRPGHIFPLKAMQGGVIRRAGHTEAAVDLARFAGCQPAGVLVEVMNEDGTMARLPQLEIFAQKHGFKLISIKDLIAYRLATETQIRREITIDLPTRFGNFQLTAYTQLSDNKEHLVIHKGTWDKDEPILVRVHSSCMTGDIFGSCRCDCGEQLAESLRKIEELGKGMVIYMQQEGRGIGLINKLKAYQLQEQGLDTVEANLQLGFNMDERDYGIGAQILRDMQVTKMRLMTNNPTKKAGLLGYNLAIVEIVPLEVKPNEYNKRYLETKRDKMGHTILS